MKFQKQRIRDSEKVFFYPDVDFVAKRIDKNLTQKWFYANFVVKNKRIFLTQKWQLVYLYLNSEGLNVYRKGKWAPIVKWIVRFEEGQYRGLRRTSEDR